MESSHADAATTSAPADAKCQPSSSSSMDSSSMEEWRSTHHLHASAASSSCPPTWESDDEDDNYFGLSHIGPRPSDLYGKFTWKIENFAHISKRELRSNIFEVGGYKWYILVYPQGCDVCNHLSLFLCVADYDKLLPGWNHFAQFTIAIVNRDPKKSKYSDTLHRFCKKEHDWGWKKFMELSKVTDGFIVSETLVIKAQVQVIRENSHRLFRCLDSQYRRELVCVYLTNVEGICRRFIDEKREKIGKLMEDTIRWSSFQAFWSTVDDNMRRKLVREKTDVILKAMLKRFFNEKEVTSTLVMDALYSGCKALNHSNKHKKGRINGVEMEERPNSFVSMDNGSFLLAGDILLMLERAATEPLPYYKDEKVHQNRTKDASLGDESGKDSVVRDERRLVELGRRTVEMFVLAYVFSNRIEVAYREAIALKRQEELIREEEAAGQAELELRAKREAAEKEKRARKKQAKQRRKNQKDKEKDVEEKHIIVVQHPRPREDVFSARVIRNGRLKGQQLSGTIRGERGSQDVSNHNNISDEVIIQRLCAKENGEADSAGWEMYQSETHQDMVAGVSGAASEDSTQSLQCHRKHQRTTLLDDSSSTWSSDSLPSIITRSHGSIVQSFMHMDIKQAPSNREIIKLNNSLGCDDVRLLEADLVSPSNLDADGTTEQSSNCSTAELDAETVILSLKEKTRWLEQRLAEKEEEVVMLQKRLSLVRNQMDSDRLENKFNLSKQASTCTKLQDLNNGKPNSPSKIPEDRYVQCQGTCDIEVAEIFKQPQDSNSQSAACDVTSLRKEKENQVINHPPSWHDLSVSSKTETESYVSEACSLSVSLVSQKFASEETTLAHPSSQIGPSTATVLRTEVSRPSSAPAVAGLQPGVNIATQYVKTLARSASAASKIGNESSESETESKPAVLEYQSLMPEPIAASGTILCNSSISSAGAPASKSSANAICFSGIESVSKQDVCSSIAPGESELLSFTAVSDQDMSLKPSIFLEGIANAKVFPEPQSATSVVAVTRERSNMNSFEDSVSYHSINNRTSIDFMFGTITPDVLHLEQQRIWQCGYDLNHEPSDDNLLISQQFMPREQYVNQREKVRDPTECFVWAAQNSQQVEWSQNSNLQPSSLENHSITHASGHAVVTAVEKLCSAEDFPHLDIINNLFDEDKSSRETIGAYVQQPENHGFQYDPPFLKFNSANFRIEDLETGMSVVHGIDGNDRGFSYAAELAELPNYENHMNLNRDFQCSSGSSMAHLFSGQSRLIDKTSSLNWIGGSFGMPLNGRFDSGQLMMDTHVQYPLQDQHLSMAESASLSFLQHGYSLHNQGE